MLPRMIRGASELTNKMRISRDLSEYVFGNTALLTKEAIIDQLRPSLIRGLVSNMFHIGGINSCTKKIGTVTRQSQSFFKRRALDDVYVRLK